MTIDSQNKGYAITIPYLLKKTFKDSYLKGKPRGIPIAKSHVLLY